MNGPFGLPALSSATGGVPTAQRTVAAAVLFLASDAASFITGVDLLVDGGAGSF